MSIKELDQMMNDEEFVREYLEYCEWLEEVKNV